MKLNVLKEWRNYAGLLAFFAMPVFLFFLSSSWQVRFISALVLFFSFKVWLLWRAFGPLKNLGKEGKTIWPKYVIDRFGDRVYIGTRALILLCALTVFFLVTLPLGLDVIAVIRNEAPVVRQAKVTHISGTAHSSSFMQTIRFNYEAQSAGNDYNAFLFSLGFFKYGGTYEILYLPHSRFIVEAYKSE